MNMQYVNQVTNNFLSHFRNNQPPLVVCRHYKVILENCTETWKHTNIHSDIAPIIFPSDMNASNLKSIFKLMSPTEFKSKSVQIDCWSVPRLAPLGKYFLSDFCSFKRGDKCICHELEIWAILQVYERKYIVAMLVALSMTFWQVTYY